MLPMLMGTDRVHVVDVGHRKTVLEVFFQCRPVGMTGFLQRLQCLFPDDVGETQPDRQRIILLQIGAPCVS